MISHGKNIKIFSGNSHPALAMQIASALGLPLGKATISTFADGEISVSISESVRGSDVFLVQSTCGPVNNNLMELLIMIDSCKRASAGRITAVIPYFGYARQDRKSKARDPISAKLVANLITAAGADRVLTMDLHAAQIQGFFDIPVDNMLGSSVLIPYIAGKFGVGTEDTVIVSPDLGSVTRARKFTQKLDMPLAIIDKRRPKANVSEVMNIIGNVKGKKCILVDDLIDTAGTLVHAAEALVERGGVRPGDRAHQGEPDQGADHPRHHSADEREEARQHQRAVRRAGIHRGDRTHLRGDLGFHPVRLSCRFRLKPRFQSRIDEKPRPADTFFRPLYNFRDTCSRKL